MYDANGNRTNKQDLQSSASYVYDSRNRLVSETKTIDGVNYATSYTYDAASNVMSLSYPDGTVITHDYDNLNRIVSVDGYAQFSWDENSQLKQISYQNNVQTDYLYDLRGRPTQIKTTKNGSDLLNLTYGYDPAGNILQMKSVDPNQVIKEQWDYAYDSLNRLLTATGGPSGQGYSLNYQYDSTGNRIQLNNTTYTYNEMNELLALDSGDENCTFTYGIYGNCIRKEDGMNVWEYTYDYENRLTSVKENGQVLEQYIYDGDGRRIKKIDATSERVYIYGGLNLLYEVNVTTQMDAVYIYGPTGRIAKKVNDIKEYYHTDHLGSTRLVTSENGVKTEEIKYKPFGEQINTTEERYTYNGKERDDTGLYYYGARYYDPTVGRFVSRDPVTGEKESPQSLNKYVYCLNNPLKYIDPAGAETEPSNEEKIEEIFKRLQYIDPNALSEVQKLLDAGKEVEALMKILELLGFNYVYKEGDSVSVEINDEWYVMGAVEDLKVNGQDAFGCVSGKTISINFSSGKVGDVALTVLHEVSHIACGGTTADEIAAEDVLLAGPEFSYMQALCSFGVEFSYDFKIVAEGAALGLDPDEKHRVPLSEITFRWVRGLTVQW